MEQEEIVEKRKYTKDEFPKHRNLIMDCGVVEEYLVETEDEAIASIDLLLKKFKRWQGV